MTGFHDKRATSESRRPSLKRSRSPAAAPPPARRTKRPEGPVPPRKREHSGPAARVARLPRLPNGDRDPVDVAVALSPAPRAEAPVPPPKRKGSFRSAWPSTAYVLRNRQVPGTSNRKPYSPARYEKREELEHDVSFFSTKELEDDELCLAPACAHMALEIYNSMNQGDEHELAQALGVHAFLCCGMWLHANFLATRKGASNCDPKYFFAELNLDGCRLLCASCVKIDPVQSKNGCGECPRAIMHPADGDYLGAQSSGQPADACGHDDCGQPADACGHDDCGQPADACGHEICI